MSNIRRLLAPAALRPVPQVRLDDAVVAYLERKRSRGARINTLRAYACDLCDFIAHAAQHGISLVGLISDRLIEMWLDCLGRRGNTPRSQARRLAVLRGFIGYARNEAMLSHDPGRDIKVKYRARKVIAPDLDVLYRMVEDIAPIGTRNLRDRAALRLALDAGLRISEVAALDVFNPAAPAESYVDVKRLLVRVIGKGGQLEVVGINERTARYVEQWLVVRDEWASPDCPALFVSQRRVRMGRGALHVMVKKRAALAGVPAMHWHKLRHRRVGGIVETMGSKAGQLFARHAHETTTIEVYGAEADAVVRQRLRESCDLDQAAAAAARAAA